MILTRISADLLHSSNALVDSRISPMTWDVHGRKRDILGQRPFKSTENRDPLAKV
jgi:hypothetical protein